MSDVDITLIGDKELLRIIRGLEQKTQQKVLKKVLSDTAQKTFVKELRKEAPVRSGKLKASMGKVAGRSKSKATVFAGPRMRHRDRTGRYSGWVANILENAKTGRRVPKEAQALATPFGFFKSVKPIARRTDFKGVIQSTIRMAEDHTFKSIRTILNREIKKHAKR